MGSPPSRACSRWCLLGDSVLSLLCATWETLGIDTDFPAAAVEPALHGDTFEDLIGLYQDAPDTSGWVQRLFLRRIL